MVLLLSTGEILHVYRVPLSFYRGSNVILLCFDVGNRASFEKAREVFVPDIRQASVDVPIVLVGCKAGMHDLFSPMK